MRLLFLLGLCAFLAVPVQADDIQIENCQNAAAFSRAHGGLGLLVRQRGRVIFEEGENDFTPDTPRKIYSGTKSFLSVTILYAVQDGLLTLDEPASLTLTEWQHDRRRAITIRQLLNQTSGLNPGDDVIYPAKNQLAAALLVNLKDAPGTRFHYGPVNYQALGEILTRKLAPSHRSVEGYMRDKLFHPLHMDIASWKHDDAGFPMLHTGIGLTLDEWAKFGEFIITKAKLPNRQAVFDRLFPQLFIGTKANPAYGLGFWLNRPEPHTQKIADLQIAVDGDQIYPGGPTDLYTAVGASKQRLYIIPSQDLVIVRFGIQARFSDGDFLSRLMTGQPKPDVHTH